MNTVVIDYGMGNLGSVKRSLEECGASVRIVDKPDDIKTASRIVLPGVGSFTDGMNNLRSGGWVQRICQAVLEEKVPMLGICLGMQLMADIGQEGGEVKGLGVISGRVARLVADTQDVRIPHVGWNEVCKVRESPLFIGIEDGTDFYFVHSYHFAPDNPGDAIAMTPYCGGFVSAIEHENIFGMQFHPEKSSRPGLRLLRNFLEF